MAVRDNRIAAESVGMQHHEVQADGLYRVSAALAGAAGTLFAMNYSTIVANKFDFNTSILILVFVVLGGLGNMLWLHHCGGSPDHPARSTAAVCRLPDAGVCHRADPGHAGHQQRYL